MLSANYRDYIRNEFESRARSRAPYSLNAFARDLGLAPSRLSEVLSGKQGISQEVAERIAGLIGLSAEERAYFCDLAEMEHARSAEKRELAKLRLQQRDLDQSYWALQADAFQIVSDWHHFGIVQLLELPNFRNDPKWMARALGVSKDDVETAVERLLRLGVIEESKSRLRKTKDFVGTTDGVPSSAIRKFHAQVLSKAMRALTDQTVENRSFSANFMTIDKAKLPEAKEMMRKFRRRFVTQVCEAGQNRNSVYCLSMQLFELTQEIK